MLYKKTPTGYEVPSTFGWVVLGTGTIAACVTVLFLIVGLFLAICACWQHYNVWSSGMDGKAEVERAKGIAAANKIIGDSLKDNDAYLRYLWINNLEGGKKQIIYVPTESGLPILEATRLNK